MFGAYFKQFSSSFPDVNKNKGVAEISPFKSPLSSFYRAIFADLMFINKPFQIETLQSPQTMKSVSSIQ